MAATFRIHYMVPKADGPQQSGGLSLPSVPGQSAPPGTLAAACDPTLTLTTRDRGTGVPWAVHCNACVKTEVYRQDFYPRPTPEGFGGHDAAETPDDPCGCK